MLLKIYNLSITFICIDINFKSFINRNKYKEKLHPIKDEKFKSQMEEFMNSIKIPKTILEAYDIYDVYLLLII